MDYTDDFEYFTSQDKTGVAKKINKIRFALAKTFFPGVTKMIDEHNRRARSQAQRWNQIAEDIETSVRVLNDLNYKATQNAKDIETIAAYLLGFKRGHESGDGDPTVKDDPR